MCQAAAWGAGELRPSAPSSCRGRLPTPSLRTLWSPRHVEHVNTARQSVLLYFMQHQLVMDALQKLDKDRKCFRLVGDVLVERTVGETVPAVLKNRDNLKSTIESFQKQLDIQKKELAEFQEKYKIRVS